MTNTDAQSRQNTEFSVSHTQDLGFCKLTKLSNGITVITQAMSDVRSISLGFFVNCGSRDEADAQAGLSHFMEHMTFKGTPSRNAFEINRAFDAMGAESNAFTGKEMTCFYARCVDNKLSSIFEILADMLVNSRYSNDTIATERNVVLEEIARSYDVPDDYVFELATKALLKGHPLAAPVLGTKERVSHFNHDDCMIYKNQHYCSSNLCVVAAGHVNHDDIVDLCDQYLSGMNVGTKTVRHHLHVDNHAHMVSETRKTQQAHVVIGMPWMSAQSDDLQKGYVLSQALGGSMSSRLFQEIREKRGLVYSIYSSPFAYSDAGMFCVYAGTRPENVGDVIRIVTDQMKEIAEKGIHEEELSRAVESVCGEILLSEESTISRMIRLGRQQLLGKKLTSIDERVRQYREVTQKDIQDIAQKYLTATPTIALISSIEKEEAHKIVDASLKNH